MRRTRLDTFTTTAAPAERTRSMMKAVSTITSLCIEISLCAAPMAWAQERTISQDGVTLTYGSDTFSKVEIVEAEKEPLPHPRDQLNVHPARLMFRFYAESRCVGLIELYPLEDRSVEDLNSAYPELLKRAGTL